MVISGHVLCAVCTTKNISIKVGDKKKQKHEATYHGKGINKRPGVIPSKRDLTQCLCLFTSEAVK